MTTTDCCICYEELGKSNITTTPCGHSFCFSCLMKSMDMRNTCPCCRQPLREEDDIIQESDSDDDSDYESDNEPYNNEANSAVRYHWALDWNGMEQLMNTRNEANSLISVDEIAKFANENNISMKDLISFTFWRHDDDNRGKELEKKSKLLSRFVNMKETEKTIIWKERCEMMEEDTRRHNRNAHEITYTIDRTPDYSLI